MNRLLAVIRWETVNQTRQGIFYAAAFVTLMWTALLYPIPDGGVEPVLVSVLFLDLALFGFFFMAAIYFLEKAQRVLEGLVVTPLRTWEYLTAKVGVLTFTAVVVGAVVTLLVYGAGINWLWYILAVVLVSVPVSLLGFVLATRYNGINEYLVPAAFLLTVMQIPLLGYLNIWNNPLLYLIPSQPGMILLEAAFDRAAGWELGYAVAYALLWTGIGYWWAQRRFENVIARRAGNA
ncbi:MAG: fluoroquinolone transporter permease [Caldilineae bacterium]|nr:MAG: fluoroquinolone transporter permease [Caldilineae bacterium]